MTKIDFENDRMQSVEQIDSAKRLSDKILELLGMSHTIPSCSTYRCFPKREKNNI